MVNVLSDIIRAEELKRQKKHPKITAKERLTLFRNLFQKEDSVLIVISADPDSLASALAVKSILRYRVRKMVVVYPNEIRRLSNIAMVDLLKIKASRIKTIHQDEYDKFIILDSQPSHHPLFNDIQFDAVIDHHPISGDWQAPYVDIRADYGAVASMMVEYLRAAEIKPSVAIATALFYAIKVDTRNFEKQAKLADAISFRYLFNIANKNLVRKIELSEMRLSELNYFKTAFDTMKVSNNRLYAHVGRVFSPDVLVIIADFFNRVHPVSWVFISGIHGERLVVIFRCDGYRKNAGTLAAKAFGEIGSAGGHREAARAEVPLKNLDKNDQDFDTQTLRRLTRRHL
jgi:nanoRNase/pAp phosphatase (c-di-AMP/oligoRNAs hydrolase)